MDLQGIFDPIANVLGILMKYIYLYVSFENYGVAIIIFTIITRLILLPLNLKQYKSMAKMQKIQPELKELQARYKNDKERLQQATVELYRKHQVNPAGGCLPLLIQMPLLFSLYYVIRQPLKFMFGIYTAKAPEPIEKIADYIIQNDATYEKVFKAGGDKLIQMNADLPIIRYFSSFGDKITAALADLADKTGVILETKHIINMNFLGLKLGETPTINTTTIQNNPSVYVPLLLIPILAAVTTYLSSKVSQSATAPQSGGMGKSMMYLFPAMTLLFTFSLPAGLGLYWIVGNIIQIIQQKVLQHHTHKQDEIERIADDEQKRKEAEERQKLIEQREFDKNLLKSSNVSKKKIKNIAEREKKTKKNPEDI